jgi:hypothetical protein
MVLCFNLKTRYYNMYLSGKKKEEYRIANSYWAKRLSNLKPGDTVHLVKGYTDEFIEAKFISWSLISGDMLPGYLRFIMDKNSMWYKIYLELSRPPEKHGR